MNEEMRRLIRLQDLMLAGEELAEKIAAVPAEVARLEKALSAEMEQVERAQNELQELQKDRRTLEMELMGVESRIEKYQAQLSEVKTNKEYQAVLKEIETCRAERAALDEKILMEMEEGEKGQSNVRAVEQRVEEKRRNMEQEKKRLADLKAALERDQQNVETEREQLSKEIPAAYLDPFMKVARQRKGVAIVAVREELCGGCHVRVMPKLIQMVRRATGLIACDSCKRFLYVAEDAGPGEPAAPDSPTP